MLSKVTQPVRGSARLKPPPSASRAQARLCSRSSPDTLGDFEQNPSTPWASVSPHANGQVGLAEISSHLNNQGS